MACPLCQQDATAYAAMGPSGGVRAATLYDCGTCGPIVATHFFNPTEQQDRWHLSAITRAYSTYEKNVELTTDYRDLLKQHPLPSPPEQMDMLLKLIIDRSGAGHQPVKVDPGTDYPLAWASGPEGLLYLLRSLRDDGFIKLVLVRLRTGDDAERWQPTMSGYERLEFKRKQPRGATGWERVDRGLKEAEERLAAAENEEQFQAVGHHCREVLISLGQAVYDPQRHPSTDGKNISKTDSARMLDAYVAVELGGGENADLRRAVKASESLTDALTHKRSADQRAAALCLESTRSLVEQVAIIAGKRKK